MTFDWLDIIYLVGIPLIQQLLKLLSEQYGWVLNKWQNQLLTLVLAIIVGLLAGNFANIGWCGWEDDLFAFIGCNLLGVVAAWAAVSAVYEVIWDRLFVFTSNHTALRLATEDKVDVEVYG